MARAGFWAIHTDKLIFRCDGRWYADGEPVVHERLALLFSRYLRRKLDGHGYEIWIDTRYHADVEIEDTPYVVTGVDVAADGDVSIHLNDGTTEALVPESLRIGAGAVLYCTVKDGREKARFLRSAYYDLAQHIEEAAPGEFRLHCAGATYPIARA
jgi:hypothetical protein